VREYRYHREAIAMFVLVALLVGAEAIIRYYS
jgi:hypothetical protein